MKQSIAQRKEREATLANARARRKKPDAPAKKGHLLGGLLACAPFAAVAYFCKYIMPGYSFTALVCIGIIGVILFYSLMPLVGRVLPRFAKIATVVFSVALVVGLALFCVTEYFVIRASFGNPEDHAAYMVVLGAKVRPDGPSVSLQDRIDAAYAYMTANPDVTAIVSGGQGHDEIMTEAQCMFDELTGMGIPAGRVWMEPRATSTDENLRFSLDLIQEKTGRRPDKLAVLSSEYHLFRASLMANKLGIGFVGVPAKTSVLSQLVNHCMREVAGVWHFFIFGR